MAKANIKIVASKPLNLLAEFGKWKEIKQLLNIDVLWIWGNLQQLKKASGNNSWNILTRPIQMKTLVKLWQFLIS